LSLPVELVACFTCGGNARDESGRTQGEQLLAQLHAANQARAESPVSVTSVRCLWLCKRSCSVHLRAQGRVSYLLAELEASETTANALLDYASMYAASVDGAVPFKQWPQPLRGHFVARLPAPSPPSHNDVSASEE
jgi:predicted metal-binding protein